MGRLARRIGDKRMLKIIRSFLNAGMMLNGVVIDRDEGTPQGGRNLSTSLRHRRASV
jgi:RNA-directed DNA polymerase